MTNRRRALLAVAAAVLVAAAAGLAVGLGGRHSPLGSGPTPAERAARRALAEQARVVAAATGKVALGYPASPGDPAPVWSPSAFVAPLPAHVVFGFAPWYSLSQLSAADYRDVSVIAYDGIDLLANGALDERTASPGWQTFRGAAFSDLVTRAHAAKDQVLLTVYSGTPAVIAGITSHPVAAGTRLAAQIQPLLADDELDGVDVDVEGSGPAERPGFVAFMRAFASHLRANDPGAAIVVDTYPGSAGDPQSFFDVAALAPLVDSIFVMAYDMYQTGYASPNAPLTNPDLGLSDVQSMLAYVKAVPPRKLLLGVPFYGYDFTTRSGTPGAPTKIKLPEAVTWQTIVAAGHRAQWDPNSDTPWYGFRLKGVWHETYFDDPASIALKTALASDLHLQGVGVWALGMEAGDASMLAALLGGTGPRKLPLTTSTVLGVFSAVGGHRTAPA